MKNFLLGFVLIAFNSFVAVAQVSQTFNSLTGNPFNSTACYFTDLNTSAHTLTNFTTGSCGNIIVTGPNSGTEIGFSIDLLAGASTGFSDGDYFGVGLPSAVASQTGLANPDGTNSFMMEDTDGTVEMTFSPVDLTGTINPMVSIEYLLGVTAWESTDILSIDVIISGCAASTTLSLINVDGTDIENGGLEGSWNTLSANLTPYIGCISQVVIRFASNAATEEVAFDNLVFSQGTLPVAMKTFYGEKNSEDVDLFWATSIEVNNDHFLVERSSDRINFTAIGKVVGNGTTFEEKEYSFIDRAPAAGINYYRLAQFDYNGDMEYHKVIAIDNRKDATSIFPTLTYGEITISVNAPANINIYSASGSVVKSFNLEESKLINLADLPKGIYTLTTNTEGHIETHRFIKQ